MTISLVIPAFNEERSIGRLLDSVARQSHPPDEVILVDAGSTDRTAETAEGYRSEVPLRILRERRLNPGEARNTGAAVATGEWIAFTDAGIELDRDWLGALAAEMESDVDVVFGTYEPACPTLFTRAAAVAYVPARSKQGIRGPAAVSMAVRTEVFRRSSGFPRCRAAEDLIYFDTLRQEGVRIHYAPPAVARWEVAQGFAATLRRFALYSEANLLAGYGRHWHRGLLRQYLFVGLTVGLVLVTTGSWFALGLLPLWFAARAFRAAWEKQGDLPFSCLRPAVVGVAAFVLLTTDVATWVGACRYLSRRQGA